MTPLKIFLVLGIFLSGLPNGLHAQQLVHSNQSLDKKQQSIVPIAAFTAKGDVVALQKALSEVLNAGVTVNEIKEVLVQLYAYAGFPRSLNAINTFMAVLKERKAQGINDPLGREPSPLPTDKTRLQWGTELQTKLVGQPVKGEVYAFAPVIDQFLKEHLFSDIFGRDNPDWKTRELATIAALASLGGTESQLRFHFEVGLYNGLTEGQLDHLVSIVQSRVGAKEGNAASQVWQTVLQERGVNKATQKTAATHPVSTIENSKEGRQTTIGHQATTLFPKGEKITNNNFTGNAWLGQMIMPDSLNPTQVGSITFDPGARTNWHVHPDGQILLITGGTGYYQEKGSPKKIIKKGEVVRCPPNVPHWHGASKDEALIQIAITNTHKGAVVWLQPVTDEEYNQAVK